MNKNLHYVCSCIDRTLKVVGLMKSSFLVCFLTLFYKVVRTVAISRNLAVYSSYSRWVTWAWCSFFSKDTAREQYGKRYMYLFESQIHKKNILNTCIRGNAGIAQLFNREHNRNFAYWWKKIFSAYQIGIDLNTNRNMLNCNLSCEDLIHVKSIIRLAAQWERELPCHLAAESWTGPTAGWCCHLVVASPTTDVNKRV